MIPPAGQQRAEVLVEEYAQHIGASGRKLGEDSDVSFGSTGLHYSANEDAIYARAYVNNALIEGAPPEELANYRKMVSFLNEPSVGGMFDRAGGYFVLDEQKQAYFLVRRFDVSRTTPSLLNSTLDRLQTVAAVWTTKWLGEVAMIMHGHAKPPQHQVSMEQK